MKNLFALCLIAFVFVACTPTEDNTTIIETVDAPAPANIIYVTPTLAPTLVPTAVRFVASATPTQTAEPSQTPTITPTLDTATACSGITESFYATASDLCLGGPSGYFCNGGLPPDAQPTGSAADGLTGAGALIEATELDSVRTAPLTTNSTGGVVWLRLEEEIQIDALMVGDVHITNVVPDGSDFPRWQNILLQSQTADTPCDNLQEIGALVIQGLYGVSTRVIVNGVSVDIIGTVVVLTQDTTTKFIVIEGQARIISFGQTLELNAGMQTNVGYNPDDWTTPINLPEDPLIMEYDLVKNLPIVLFDRPVAIPQAGYVETQGMVNMRIAPDLNSQLLYQVPAGEVMNVLGVSSDRAWYHIRLGNGETGWMSADLLSQTLDVIENVYDATPEPPQRVGNLGRIASVIVEQGGNLRTAPDVGFGVKQTVPFGSEVELIARSPYSPWVKVNTGNDEGWMALITLKTASVISSLPIDYTVPLPTNATATPSFSYGGGHAYPDPNGGF